LKVVHIRKGGVVMKYAYVRVSTVEQNEERQIEGLEKHGIDKWFIEKVSGKDTNRTELQTMLDVAKAGDTIYVHDFSRLARSTKDLLEIVEMLTEREINLVSNKENIDTSTPAGKLMLTVLAAIYEFERTNMLERQAEGIEIAKRENKYANCGRKKTEITDEYEHLIRQYVDGKVTKVQLAVMMNVSRPTLNRILNEYGGADVE
jgi:DNA invertase Pin-like site-specific DNA recombinase